MGLRDRLLTPAGARAVTSPSAILLAGVGAAVGIVALGPAGAVAGVATYLARVVTALPKAPTRDTARRAEELREPWAGFFREATDARDRFSAALSSAQRGVVRERLEQVGARVDDGVEACWRAASRGQALDAALRQMDATSGLRGRIAELTRSGEPDPESADGRILASTQAQLASRERLEDAVGRARSELRVLDARLDEAVARAVELGVGATDVGDLSGLDSTVDAVVADMEALRQALEETSAPRPGTA